MFLTLFLLIATILSSANGGYHFTLFLLIFCTGPDFLVKDLTMYYFFTFYSLLQGWATLFDSWATLETKLVNVGQYNKRPIWYVFWKNGLLAVHFLKRSVSNGIILFFKSAFKKCSRATIRCLAGRMWPAGRTLSRPGLLLSYTITFRLAKHMIKILFYFSR